MEIERRNSVLDYVAGLPPSTGITRRREIVFKLLLIGDVMVGKTSLVRRYVNNVFLPYYKATIGVDFSLKVLQWSDDLTVKIQLWDIAGMERFSSLTRAYYRNANGCLVMFDLNDQVTFKRAEEWKQDLDSKYRLSDGSAIPCLLLGNKSDLPEYAVTKDEIEELSTRRDFIGWRQISVKENVGVDEAVRLLVQRMLEQTGRTAPSTMAASYYTAHADSPVTLSLTGQSGAESRPRNEDCRC